MSEVLLGTDPEGFLVRKDGRFLSAAGFFPGTKKKPFALEKGAVQVDGVALEFNIEAARTEEEFNGNIETVLAQINEMVEKEFGKDVKLTFTPYAVFEKEDWDKIDAEAKVLGCDPDYNVSGEVNPNPTDILENATLRTAAGHVHIGFTKDEDLSTAQHFTDCLYVARKFFEHKMKHFVPETWEERERLKYYGAFGAFRHKSYGVELRSPSNLWVARKESRLEMFRNTHGFFNKVTGL